MSKALIWLRDSKRNLMEFPEKVRREFGHALHFAQEGEMHPSCKPLKGFGSGVFEIIQDFNKDTYRVVYAVKLKDKVYVLHAFQKKSKQGIKTPPKDLALIKERLRRAKELANE